VFRLWPQTVASGHRVNSVFSSSITPRASSLKRGGREGDQLQHQAAPRVLREVFNSCHIHDPSGVTTAPLRFAHGQSTGRRHGMSTRRVLHYATPRLKPGTYIFDFSSGSARHSDRFDACQIEIISAASLCGRGKEDCAGPLALVFAYDEYPKRTNLRAATTRPYASTGKGLRPGSRSTQLGGSGSALQVSPRG
jgi:hypothetical protein